jgi:hypothetical protein
MRRVTIGAMSSLLRRPDDAAGDADVMRSTYVTRGLGGDPPETTGTFDVERPQMAMRTVGSGLTGLDDFTQYGISIEPGQQAPSVPTEVVATGQVTS